MPEISCESEWYERIYWVAIMPALFVYMIIIPALIWHQLKRNAHWIFHSGRARENLTEDEEVKAIVAKSAFGFFFTGLTISKNLGRPLVKDDFPIENSGTTDPSLVYNRYKVCC